ncbi:hypothetical protein [Microbacterium sp. SLBN-146]|uniref:beta-xylosidase family glycoside hydrolase n=1 Tax=Microbacterium sp. SLBN-146 TaxID=2768457 RepID=UPI001151B7D7|nr:hypothetical protein [Microbacterium sp. SLBN-146]TQJ30451.1 hypothetical protein FBY39_0903 [Microbacterium sp. SLBN-146]
MSLRSRCAAVAVAVALVLSGTSAAQASTADPDGDDLPIFTSTGPIIDPLTTETWNPTKEYIFPTIFHAGKYLDDPLGEWYFYFGPHDNPGGINLMYSDSLDGPWTFYRDNPIVTNTWEPHYDVSHVAAADVIYNEDLDKIVMYFHGENTTSRYATSDDGVNFDYGDVIMTTSMFGQNSSEVSYGRVFANPEVDNPASDVRGYAWAQYFMVNDRDNTRRVGLAVSHDGISWEPRSGWVAEPNVVTGPNIAPSGFWQYDGRNYVLFHGSVGKIFAKRVDENLRSYGDTEVLYVPDVVPPEAGRSSSPRIIEHDGKTHMFYEAGVRSHTTIFHAVLDPDGVRDPLNARPFDPMYEQCQAAGSDEFEATTLGDQWTTVGGTTDSPRLEDGALVLDTAVATTTNFGRAPTVRQQLPVGQTWEYTTELEFNPTQIHQQAGLFLHRDDRNNARAVFGWARQGGEAFQLRFDFTWKKDNVDRFNTWVWQDAYFPGDTAGDRVWLRLTNNGEFITASLSTDGREFLKLGQPIETAALAPTTIGLGAARSTAEIAEIPAAFHWFRATPNVDDPLSCDPPEAHRAPTVSGSVSGRTVTLSAQPFGTATIANFGYTINGGRFVTYTGPFEVPGTEAVRINFSARDSFGAKSEDGELQVPARVTDTRPPEVRLTSPTAHGPFSVFTPIIEASDEAGLAKIVADVYDEAGALVESTQTAASGATSATHTATIVLPDGSYTLQYTAHDLAGNVAETQTFGFTTDSTKPTATIKSGARYTVQTGDSYEIISFKLFDAQKIDRVVLNGTVKNLTDDAWSDVNFITPGMFGAVAGVNTMTVHDVAGNTRTYTFTLN